MFGVQGLLLRVLFGVLGFSVYMIYMGVYRGTV